MKYFFQVTKTTIASGAGQVEVIKDQSESACEADFVKAYKALTDMMKASEMIGFKFPKTSFKEALQNNDYTIESNWLNRKTGKANPSEIDFIIILTIHGFRK